MRQSPCTARRDHRTESVVLHGSSGSQRKSYAIRCCGQIPRLCFLRASTGHLDKALYFVRNIDRGGESTAGTKHSTLDVIARGRSLHSRTLECTYTWRWTGCQAVHVSIGGRGYIRSALCCDNPCSFPGGTRWRRTLVCTAAARFCSRGHEACTVLLT